MGELQAAHRRGDIVGLVRAARDLSGAVPAARVRDVLLALLPDVALPGGLSAHPVLAGWLLSLCDGRSGIPESVWRVCGPLPSAIGEALFPVAEGDEHGRLLRLRVGRRDVLGPPPESEADFATAVERARVWAFRKAGRDPTLGIEALSWQVDPLPVDRNPLSGASVGLAALVAWTSWLHRVAPPPGRVYTGVLGEEGGRLELRRVRTHTLAAKARAVHAIAPRARVHLHPEDAECWPDTSRAASLSGIGSANGLSELFPVGMGETTQRIDPRGTATRAPELGEVARSALAVLCAAEGTLGDELLEKAIEDARAAAGCAPGDPLHLPTVLTTLAGQGLIERSTGTPTALGTSTMALPRAPRWRRAAHGALAGRTELPLAQRLSHLLQADPTAGPRAAATALHAALSTDPGKALHELERLSIEHRPERVVPIAQALVDGDTPPAPAVGLAALLLAGLELPPPLGATARATVHGDSWVEWLLGAQALFELCLHFIAAVALAVDAVEARTRGQLDDRPSMGLLAEAAEQFIKADAPGHPCARAVWGALAEPAEGRAGLLSAMDAATKTLNELHAGTGLSELVSTDAESVARERLGRAAPAIHALVQRLTAGLTGRIRLGPNESRTHLLLHTDDCDRPLPLTHARSIQMEDGTSMLAWRRGRIGEAERWWSLSSSRAWGGADLVVTGAPAPSPGALPLPLARAAVAVARARHQGPLGQLAAIDLTLGVLLRLANAPAFATAGASPSEMLEHGSPIEKALARGNHRNHAQVLTSGAVDSPLADLLRGPLHGHVLRLIDGVERLQHAPGPFAVWAPDIDALYATLDELLAEVAALGAPRLPGGEPLLGPALRRSTALSDLRPTFCEHEGEVCLVVDVLFSRKRSERRQLQHARARLRPLPVGAIGGTLREAAWPWAPADPGA